MIKIKLCPACSGWYVEGGKTPLPQRGADNIGMEWRYQCPCRCVCGDPVRACACPGGPTFVLVTAGIDGKPWNPPSGGPVKESDR